MRKMRKVLLVIERWCIRKLAYINVDVYMTCYTKHLRKVGINIEGTPKFIHPDTYFDGSDYSRISIGDNVTISVGVMLLTHDYSITTACASLGRAIARHEGELYLSQGVSLGRNCFIGARTTILPGATIGDNVIVGACSVVKGHIPDGSVAVGNPCRAIADTRAWAERKLESKDLRVEDARLA